MKPCPCGKRAWTSRREADEVVISAKIRAGLRGSTRRRETRVYACPVKAGLWHVTSQPGSSTDVPWLPEHLPSDDEAAADCINDALRHQNDAVWNVLLADDRVEQTCRVLSRLEQQLIAQETERTAQVEAVRARCRAGEATPVDVEIAAAEREEWRARVAHFRAAVNGRLAATRQAVKALNVARSTAHNTAEKDTYRDALRLLTLAVARHVQETEQPTPADRRLWAWLTALTVPNGDGTLSLADMVAGRQWTDDPDELRRSA